MKRAAGIALIVLGLMALALAGFYFVTGGYRFAEVRCGLNLINSNVGLFLVALAVSLGSLGWRMADGVNWLD